MSFKVARIGKIRPKHDRPLKIMFGSKQEDTNLLTIYSETKKSGTIFSPNVCIVKDKTPLQRELLRNFHSELDRRTISCRSWTTDSLH